MANGEGPGAAHVPIWGVIGSLLWLVLLSVLSLYFLVAFWPHPTPSGTTPSTTEATARQKAAPTAPATSTTSTSATSTTGTLPTSTTGTLATSTAGTSATATGAQTGTGGATTPASVASQHATSPSEACVQCASDDPDVKAECDCWQRVVRIQSDLYDSTTPRALKNDPSCVYLYGFGGWHIIWGETRLLITVILCGFLGSMIYSLRSFFWYVGNRALIWSWLAMYLLIPIVGSMMAVIFYLLLRGGLFSPGATVSDTSPFGFAAIAALVGMFTQQSAVKLKTVFETLMAKGEQGSNSAPVTPPQPVLTSVSPMKPPPNAAATITLKGAHFTNQSTAYGGSTPLSTTPVSDAEMTAVVPAAMIPVAGTTVAITVRTGSAVSAAITITAT